MDTIATAIGLIFGGTLLLLGIGGFLWLLLDWAGFSFGYHHVGLSLWSYFFGFSLLSIIWVPWRCGPRLRTVEICNEMPRRACLILNTVFT